MENRLTRLEVEFEHVRKDLNEIKGDLKQALGVLPTLATKTNLINYTLVSMAIALAVIGIFVGVLTYLAPLK